jgi:outer membrane protein assembly factor BamD
MFQLFFKPFSSVNFSQLSHRFCKIAGVSSALIVLSACQSDDNQLMDMPVHDLYKIGKDNLKARNYTKAAVAFADVERQHPYSNWALRAQIMSAYCFYQAKKYDDAIDGFKTFIQLHPGHQDVAYAYYMIGLSFYEQIPIVSRDQEPARRAAEAFGEVINRFKSSIYSKDARFKLDFIKDHVAAKEMNIGRFYQSRGSHLSALNRFKDVVENYSTTNQAPEALYRLVECYLALGLRDEAKASAAVLGYNHKDSSWYKNAYDILQLPLPLTIPTPEDAAELEKNSDNSMDHLDIKKEIEELDDLQQPPNGSART